jgi:hypothetical protein
MLVKCVSYGDREKIVCLFHNVLDEGDCPFYTKPGTCNEDADCYECVEDNIGVFADEKKEEKPQIYSVPTDTPIGCIYQDVSGRGVVHDDTWLPFDGMCRLVEDYSDLIHVSGSSPLIQVIDNVTFILPKEYGTTDMTNCYIKAKDK